MDDIDAVLENVCQIRDILNRDIEAMQFSRALTDIFLSQEEIEHLQWLCQTVKCEA